MKEIILKYIRNQPLLRKILSKIYLMYIRFFNKSKKITFKKIYYISPKDIKFSVEYFDIFKDRWKIVGGDWDIDKILFAESTTYRGLKERFVKDLNWEDTVYYKENLKQIKKGKNMWNCCNEKEFRKRCKKLDKLFFDIKKNGYKLNPNKISGGYDEVTINIGRKGELLFNDGAHRLSMAKILGIHKIPVRIIARHANWYALIRYLQSVLPNNTSYQSLGHVDLDTNFTIQHPCTNRWEMIKPHIKQADSTTAKSLDIGGNIGFFTKKLEQLGFDAYIIEHESFYIKILEKFKTLLGYKYTIIGDDMFTWKGIQEHRFDVVLALNIFHHFIKTEPLYRKLTQFLNNLHTESIIFEAHNPQEDQMQGVYKNYTPLEFVAFIMKETGLTKYKKVGTMKEDGREIYKISR